MTGFDSIPPRALAVLFEDFNVWSVGSFHHSDWAWPPEYIKPLSAALKRKQVDVNRKEHQLDDLQLVTLHFDGSIEPRNINGKNQFKGKLNFASSGDVIYSKIDVRNGAIGIVPKNMPYVAVSSEYPVYKVDSNIAVPQFIQLLFRTSRFRQTINSMISGASGRKRVQPSQIESLKVPLPPIPLQQAIVSKWQKAQKEIQLVKERVERHKVEIQKYFFKSLGLKLIDAQISPRSFAVEWEDFLRWSVSYNQTVQSGANITAGKYPVIQLGSILELLQYGTSVKANTSGKGIPIIRMNNIVEGLLNLSNIKHVDLTDNERERLLLKDGDILFNRTNSKELVGKCAVFHESGEYVFASYLIRVRVNLIEADPDYVAYVINSQIGRQQIDALSRQIIGQANMNSEELRSLRIPLPPPEVQRSIARRIEEERAKIACELEHAERKALGSEAELEDLISGAKKIGES